MSTAGANAAVIASIASIAARELRIQKEIYSLVVNGISNIDRIAAMIKMSKKSVVWYLEKTIREANTRKSRYWYDFVGAYIDGEKSQIVLKVSTKDLIVITGEYNKVATKWYSSFGWTFLIFAILLAPITFGITLVVLGGAAIAFFILAHHTKKIIKRFEIYYDLLDTKKVTSIRGIAQATQQSSEIIRTEIQDLIDKKIFVNAKIDMQNDEVIIGTLLN